MPNADTAVSIHPYFKVSAENLDAFKALFAEFTKRAETEDGCLYYSFTLREDVVHCREGYRDAEALLFHIGNVSEVIEKATGISEIVRLEIHGPASELEKLKEPLAEMPVEYYTLETGFCN